MEESEVLSYVQICIEKLCNKFRKNPEYFISMEQDLVAYLYHLIAMNPFFLDEIEYTTEDGEKIKTKLIETQTRTFALVNTKVGRFDLTVLNPKQEVGEKENLIAIEFKWIGRLYERDVLDIKKDLDKLNNKENEVKWGYQLIFSSDKRLTEEGKSEILTYNKNQSTKILFIERGKPLEGKMTGMKPKVLLFKYNKDRWGEIEDIKRVFEADEYDYQPNKLASYGIEPEDKDRCLGILKDTMEICFICRIRKPSQDENGEFDFVDPIFFENPLDFKTMSTEPLYKLFRPSGTGELTRAVLFNLSEFSEHLEEIKEKLIQLNPSQSGEIRKYFVEN